MSEPSCNICLEQLRTPVTTPCGHLHCSQCLMDHIDNGTTSFKSTCPTCRAPFSIVGPDLAYVPKKYHEFIIPSVRRVYFDVSPHTDYKNRIQNLETRVRNLERDKALLMEKCETSIANNKIYAVGERNALAAVETAKKETEKMRGKYEAMKVKYGVLKDQSSADAENKRTNKEVSQISGTDWDMSVATSSSSTANKDTPPRLRITRPTRPLPKSRHRGRVSDPRGLKQIVPNDAPPVFRKRPRLWDVSSGPTAGLERLSL